MTSSKRSGISAFLRQVVQEDWLSVAIDRHFNRKRPERWVVPDPTIHPSSLGSVCTLESELGLLGHKTRIEGKTSRIFENGTSVGKRWVETFREMRILVSFETPVVRDDPLVNGSVDVIVQNSLTGEKSVGEIKSINSRGFRTLPSVTADRRGNMLALSACSPWIRKYCLQLTMYLTLSGLAGWFLFENKDTQEYKVFWVQPTPEMRAECFDAGHPAVDAQRAFYAGALVPPPFKQTSQQCKGCDRQRVCFSLQAGDEETGQSIQGQFRKAGQDPPQAWETARRT